MFPVSFNSRRRGRCLLVPAFSTVLAALILKTTAAAAQNAAHGFASAFFIAAASFAIALMAIVRLEEKPLRAGGEEDVE